MNGITLTELCESDIKNLLKQHDPDLYEYFKKAYRKVERSDNSDHAKLPSVSSIIKELEWDKEEDIYIGRVIQAIKKLGNFA